MYRIEASSTEDSQRDGSHSNFSESVQTEAPVWIYFSDGLGTNDLHQEHP